MEEGGVQGCLNLSLHFCGEAGENELAYFWHPTGYLEILGILSQDCGEPHSSSSTLCCLLFGGDHLARGRGKVMEGVMGACGKNDHSQGREYILCSVLALCSLYWVSSVEWWKRRKCLGTVTMPGNPVYSVSEGTSKGRETACGTVSS